MFRIGDFSRIARVSARLLRFYDELGLFRPAHADPQTGYRSYTIAQLVELNRITVLKELGFSLEQIGDLLKSPPDAAALRHLLLLKRDDVIERSEPAHRLLSLRRTLASFAEARTWIGALREQARALLPKAHRCQLV